MYDRERTHALIDEAQKLAAALKVETQEIGKVIERAFDEDEAGEDQETNALPRKSRWWFWR